MMTFVSLFLWVISGTQPVEVAVEGRHLPSEVGSSPPSALDRIDWAVKYE
ncbi:MAG: hypothetical protein KAJ78_07110 [Acidobacteria bacterium]|nr:hypothetical protein [Acidobacteriota bacterium]